MALQNRVTPFGEIVATAERGTLMGNRGGCLHDHERRLGRRRWVSKAWIICALEFRGRHREVMSPGRYTELFFLDEATALAAGHRPCFECRRAEARAFAKAWSEGRGLSTMPTVKVLDTALHGERLGHGRTHPTVLLDADSLPDGTMILHAGAPHLVTADAALRWSLTGYGRPVTRPRGPVPVVTPPSTVRALAAGYETGVHLSARQGA